MKRIVPEAAAGHRRGGAGRRVRHALTDCGPPTDYTPAVTRSATIIGVGSTLPPRLVPNTWFEDKIDTNDEWIRERTGIEARHFVEEGVDTSDLVVEAAQAAMSTAAITPHQLDLIVVASVTGDTPFPATAVWAQEKLGVGVPAFDVNAACAGFSYGLASATAFVQAGMADTVLLAGRRSSAGSSTSRTARPRSSSAMARAP